MTAHDYKRILVVQDIFLRGSVLADGGTSHSFCLRHGNGHFALCRALHAHGG